MLTGASSSIAISITQNFAQTSNMHHSDQFHQQISDFSSSDHFYRKISNNNLR
ncbi:hypothetical protein RND71_017718 [Anisodus tanguticus]|uniref:Uncharacterized protein n=1 Tax=Anisodus tanguticus TaxID=243964 RepID=A0AAE1S4A2_9SOLA|nr:hypothetical protein RND71_017718 [Anisodus tanguticus]